MVYADFNHFIAYGSYLSVDLRVKVRDMITGRPVKTLAVSHKIAEYEIVRDSDAPDGSVNNREVFYRLYQLVEDLALLADKEGYLLISQRLHGLQGRAIKAAAESGSYSGGVSHLIEDLFCDNHRTPLLSWE